MFRIDAPVAEGRSEPSIEFGRAAVAAPPLRALPAAAPALAAPDEGHREPILPTVPPPLSGSPVLPGRDRPVESRQPRRPLAPIVSLVLHLLPLLLLLNWPMRPPAEIAPIPVQLVIEPPPPPPPKPVAKPAPKPAPKSPPPRGRIASEDLGDTQAKGQDQDKSETPAPAKKPAAVQESPAEAPQKTAAITPPPPAPAEIAPAKPPEPKELPTVKPLPKPALAAHQPLRRMPERGHLHPRPARFPGPAATRDEYLAYLAALTREHINLLPQGMVGSRRGQTVIDVLVLDNGAIAMLRVGRSSGYPDIDVRVEQMVRAVGRFPPLPQWFQGPSMELEFKFQFPEALDY